MADIQPLRALHYDKSVVGELADVTSPPYDVIDSAQRETLLERSPFNVVAVDLPKGEPDPYKAAGDLFEAWQMQGVVVRDPEPALWAHTRPTPVPTVKPGHARAFFAGYESRAMVRDGYAPTSERIPVPRRIGCA